MHMTEQFVTRMLANSDFVFTVTRDFMRNCQNPILVLPAKVPAHPRRRVGDARAKAEVSMSPWKEPEERTPLAVCQNRSFLKAYRPA